MKAGRTRSLVTRIGFFYACRSGSAVRPLGKRDHVSAERGGDTLGHAFRAWPTR
jgi:hypothetical protein